MSQPRTSSSIAATDIYFPGKDTDWQTRTLEDVGIDGDLLQMAIDWSNDPAHEGYPREIGKHLAQRNGEHLYDDGITLGPTRDRGAITGVVIRHGYIAKEWGEPGRVDMTFSVTKSFLSTVAGLAWDRGMIKDIHDRVGEYVDDGGFDGPHNSKITWDHMLRQINEWDGTLWGKHYAAGNTDGEFRQPLESGTHYEYNDVRVNRLALALLRLWKKPLPEVLKDEVMDPIGASDSWRWNSYRNAWAEIDGKWMESVSGGGHWGGGMWISARDLARFGYLTLRRGNWNGRQIVSDDWVKMATTPGELRPTYGFMNWTLNTDHELMPNAPENNYYHSGAGANRVWVDPEHDMVIVLRWVAPEHFNGFVDRVMAAVK